MIWGSCLSFDEILSSSSCLMVTAREYPVLLKEKFIVSQVFRRSEILFWSGEGRGVSQWYCSRVYLGVFGGIETHGTVSSELGMKEAFVV